MDNLIPDGYGQAVPSTKPVVTQALKPCAHCGSDAELIDQRVGWFVKCKSCGCTVLGQFRHDIDQQDNDEQAWALSTSIDWEAVKQTAIAAWNTRAHSPSEPSVVSQDLVEDIAFMLWKGEAVRAAPNVAKNRTPNSFRSDLNEVERERWLQQARAILPIIEAAQIAARNEALEEAAKIADEITDLAAKAKNIGLQAGAMSAAHRIRSLRTPSQHQEEQ